MIEELESDGSLQLTADELVRRWNVAVVGRGELSMNERLTWSKVDGSDNFQYLFRVHWDARGQSLAMLGASSPEHQVLAVGLRWKVPSGNKTPSSADIAVVEAAYGSLAKITAPELGGDLGSQCLLASLAFPPSAAADVESVDRRSTVGRTSFRLVSGGRNLLWLIAREASADAATKAKPSHWTAHSVSNHGADPRSRIVFQGHTLAEVASDSGLLELIRRATDYTGGLGDTRVGPDGELNPPVSDGSSDTACPAGEECP